MIRKAGFQKSYTLLLMMMFCGLLSWGCSQSPVSTQEQVEPSPEQNITQGSDAGATEGSGQESSGVVESVPEKPVIPPTPPFPKITGGTVVEDMNSDPKIVEVNLEARQSKVKLSDKVSQFMYTYNGLLPGPIIRARVGDELIVHFTNNLSEPTTVHWHGIRVPDIMDGTPRVQDPVKPGEKFTYKFKLKEAGSFWYHPHVRSHAQVELGLYGMLVVQEKENIAFTRERAIILDDILIVNGRISPPMGGHMEAMHGRNGNAILMHGKLEPLAVKAKTGDVERWRVVNVANARTMSMQFKGVKVRVIGTDGGLIPKPYFLPTTLHIPVGQRYDLEVIYENPGDFKMELLAPSQNGVQAITMVTVNVTGDKVTKEVSPPAYPTIAPMPDRKSDREVTMTFDGVNTNSGLVWRINGRGDWKEPIFTFKEGDTVTMRLKNLLAQIHPFHLHGQFFEILERNGKKAFEPGLKDSVLVSGNETVVIRAYLDNPGQWMVHCHILEHAALGMMAEIFVKPKE